MNGQHVLSSEANLIDLLTNYDEYNLQTFGLVLETNIVGENDKSPESLSGGWFEIDSETYSYVGFMSFAENKSAYNSYTGTEMYMTKGFPSDLAPNVSSAYKDVIAHLNEFRDANILLPNFMATRCNYNFVRGKFDRGDTSAKSTVVLGATEPTFRAGGATAAELLGKKFLDEHPDANMVHIHSCHHWGEKEELKIVGDAVIFFDGTFRGNGKFDLPIQVYAEVLGSK